MAEDNRPQFNSPLSRKEKLGFVGLIVLAILIIYLGFRQMSNSIHGPFAARLAASLAQPREEILTEDEQLNLLKQKDTDKDGLSDFDELKIYQTSPYLADTDSDGIPDKTEIDKGTDPNCPKGKSCGAEIVNSTAGTMATNTFASPIGNIPSVDQLMLQSLFGQNPDPKLLRDFLIKQGVDKKIVEAFTDEELKTVFQEAISATSTPPAGGAQQFLTLPNQSSLEAKDLRDLLLKQGIPADTLKKISDQELLEMMKEIK